MERINIKQVAKTLQMPEAAVRAGIKQGKIPGIAIKRERWTYYVYKEQLDEFTKEGLNES